MSNEHEDGGDTGDMEDASIGLQERQGDAYYYE